MTLTPEQYDYILRVFDNVTFDYADAKDLGMIGGHSGDFDVIKN